MKSLEETVHDFFNRSYVKYMVDFLLISMIATVVVMTIIILWATATSSNTDAAFTTANELSSKIFAYSTLVTSLIFALLAAMRTALAKKAGQS